MPLLASLGQHTRNDPDLRDRVFLLAFELWCQDPDVHTFDLDDINAQTREIIERAANAYRQWWEQGVLENVLHSEQQIFINDDAVKTAKRELAAAEKRVEDLTKSLQQAQEKGMKIREDAEKGRRELEDKRRAKMLDLATAMRASMEPTQGTTTELPATTTTSSNISAPVTSHEPKTGPPATSQHSARTPPSPKSTLSTPKPPVQQKKDKSKTPVPTPSASTPKRKRQEDGGNNVVNDGGARKKVKTPKSSKGTPKTTPISSPVASPARVAGGAVQSRPKPSPKPTLASAGHHDQSSFSVSEFGKELVSDL